MTLSRQLVLLVSFLTLILFVGVFTISLSSTQKYLQIQLGSHAKDTATSLGLSVSTALLEDDNAKVKSMADALFDSGYYRKIEVYNGKGEPVVLLDAPFSVDTVPVWFSRFFKLSPPRRDALVVKGWMQAGKVYVTSHPGYAYQQLWETAQRIFLLFSVIALVTLVLGLLVLRVILRPLGQVEQQAQNICNRYFSQPLKLPKTRELKLIVIAMNRLSERVKQMLSDADVLATGLRKQAYQHPVTGLPNRKYFMNYAGEKFEDRESDASGVLMLIQLSNFKKINDHLGYVEGDEILISITNVLSQIFDNESYMLAHMNGGDFAILMPNESIDSASELANDALKRLPEIDDKESPDGLSFRIGIDAYTPKDTIKIAFSRADNALRQADEKTNGIGVANRTEVASFPASYWRQTLKNVLVEKRVSMMLQPVKDMSQKGVIHHEALLRINTDEQDNVISAGEFIQIAQRHGLLKKLDEAMVFLVVDYIQTHQQAIAINISSDTVADNGVCEMILKKIQQLGALSSYLSIEVSEITALKWHEELAKFAQTCRSHQVKFGIDHVGRSFASLRYLHNIQPDYLKIDGSFIRGIESQPENRFYAHALRDIGHSLDALVIAESVENENVLSIVHDMRFDGVQGYHIAKPATP